MCEHDDKSASDKSKHSNLEQSNSTSAQATDTQGQHLKICNTHISNGVKILDPSTTWIDSEAKIESGVTILPLTFIQGRCDIKSGSKIGPNATVISSEIGENAIIGPNTILENVTVGSKASVLASCASECVIGESANVGPFSYLRPKTKLSKNVKVGAYVETKNVSVSEGSKIPHLSYVGDAEIGSNTNVGCGSIFANYDGVTKSKTSVGDDVKLGSNTVLVAPVEIGDKVYTGAGSVIRKDVPNGALAYSENTQHNVDGWYNKNR
jgi:bifunctional UDP-N-acetylglucosamine pyrophosphorylase/glucosamine-1-phosphate N-acetyltransferase